MKKILCILPDFLIVGGISTYNRNLLDALIDAGYDISIISRNDKVKKHRSMRVISFGSIGSIFIRKCFFILRIIYELFFGRYDLVLCNHINFASVCYIGSKLGRKKYIITTYGVEVWNIISRVKKKAINSAEAIVAISDFTKDRIVQQFSSMADRVLILPPAVDGNSFLPKDKPQHLYERHNLNRSSKVILTVGRLDKQEGKKGYYQIIDIMPELIKTNLEIVYMIVGSGDDLDNIKEYARNRKIENSIIFTGYVPDDELIDYYNLCDLFVMPSTQEGFGIVFLEALACGKPVVGGNCDGSKDALLGGELGILVNPNDKNEILLQIKNFFKGQVSQRLRDPQYLRNTVIDNYGMAKFGDRARSLVEKL